MQTDQPKATIQIERIFDAEVETLFQAWTQLEHLSQWWHPMGETLNDVKAELKQGGAVTYYIGEAGLEITGIYREVVPNQKLVYTWIWNMNDEGSIEGYTLHVEFKSIDKANSKLEVLQEGFSSVDSMASHQEAWVGSMNNLATYLSNLKK